MTVTEERRWAVTTARGNSEKFLWFPHVFIDQFHRKKSLRQNQDIEKMLASTTPFKILSATNDENNGTVFTTTKGKGLGAKGLSVFHDATTTTKHGSTIKSTRKALVDVTNSAMHAPRTVGKLGDINHGPTKPSTVQFKIKEKEEKISDHIKPAVIITSSSTTATSSSFNNADTVSQTCLPHFL